MTTGGDFKGCIHSPCNFSLNTAVRYFKVHKRNDSVWLFSTETLTQKGKHTRLLSPEIKITWLQYESLLWAMWHDCGTIHFHVLCTIERLLQMVHLHSSRKQASHLSKSGLASFCCSLALLILLCVFVFVRECVFLWMLRDVSSVAHTVRTVDRSVRITELQWISPPPPCLTAINYRCMKMFGSQLKRRQIHKHYYKCIAAFKSVIKGSSKYDTELLQQK